LLARLGRFAEARAAARRARIESDEDELELQLIERQLDLLEGGRPDTETLYERWRDLPENPIRDLRRWCLAILDAQQAIDDGQDGWPILTAARRDVVEVRPTAKATSFLRNVLVLHAAFATILWLTAAWLIG
jgi:uncharacterized membrane-anchored protein